jgi:hypothetical protein
LHDYLELNAEAAVMSSEPQYEQEDPVYQRAVEIMDQEWLASGMTREELQQSKQLAALFDRLRASGRTLEDIVTEWEGKTDEEILCEYALPAVSA